MQDRAGGYFRWMAQGNLWSFHRKSTRRSSGVILLSPAPSFRPLPLGKWRRNSARLREHFLSELLEHFCLVFILKSRLGHFTENQPKDEGVNVADRHLHWEEEQQSPGANMAFDFMLNAARPAQSWRTARSEVTEHPRQGLPNPTESQATLPLSAASTTAVLRAPRSLREKGIRHRRTRSTAQKDLGSKDKMQRSVPSPLHFFLSGSQHPRAVWIALWWGPCHTGRAPQGVSMSLVFYSPKAWFSDQTQRNQSTLGSSLWSVRTTAFWTWQQRPLMFIVSFHFLCLCFLFHQSLTGWSTVRWNKDSLNIALCSPNSTFTHPAARSSMCMSNQASSIWLVQSRTLDSRPQTCSCTKCS